MNITVIGAGYVGIVTAACLAELRHQVTCVDIDVERIQKLNVGIMPIYEPGLKELVSKNISERYLYFSNSLETSAMTTDIFFIAVGTPCDHDGNVDMHYVLNAAKSIGKAIKNNSLIVDKSTVPVGVADLVRETIQAEINKRQVNIQIEIVSNPEFLREGAAIQDFMFPDRVIIGCTSNHAQQTMLELYSSVTTKEKIYFMSVKDAEMTKYVANAMLATKISFMNEIAILCEKVNVDVQNVRIGIGSDTRIGQSFIYPGCGYGGSCFPKDVKALIKMAENANVTPLILQAVEDRNDLQKQVLPNKVLHYFGKDLKKFTIAIWGLSFKPDTDDMREASSLVLLKLLLEHGATIQAYDPVAMPRAIEILPKEWFHDNRLHLSETRYDALKEADALVLVTEWQVFQTLDLLLMKKLMRQPLIFDGRNIYDPNIIRNAGFLYFGIGRGENNDSLAPSKAYKKFDEMVEL